MLGNFHKKAFKIFPSNEIINISKNTSEKINANYLHDFLKNSINSLDYEFTINSKLFYSYFEKNNLYEIYFIPDLQDNQIPLAFIFSQIHNTHENEIFLYDEYFTLYSKGELLVFKKFSSEISTNDMLNFILHRYKININKIHQFDYKQIDEIKKQYILNKKRYKPKLIDLKKSNKHIYLLIYIFLIFLIPLIHYKYFYNENKNDFKIDKKINSLEKRYINLLEKKYKKKNRYILNTLLELKNFKLKLKTLILNKNKIHLFIESKNKLELLEFIDNYDGEIKINKLHFNKNHNNFNLEATIDI